MSENSLTNLSYTQEKVQFLNTVSYPWVIQVNLTPVKEFNLMSLRHGVMYSSFLETYMHPLSLNTPQSVLLVCIDGFIYLQFFYLSTFFPYSFTFHKFLSRLFDFYFSHNYVNHIYFIINNKICPFQIIFN